MSNLCVFLNTRIEGSGALAWVGDKWLAAFRYLFNGQTIRIRFNQNEGQREIHIYHVASFHKDGEYNSSKNRGSGGLASSSTGMIKAALSIVFLIPGLIYRCCI